MAKKIIKNNNTRGGKGRASAGTTAQDQLSESARKNTLFSCGQDTKQGLAKALAKNFKCLFKYFRLPAGFVSVCVCACVKIFEKFLINQTNCLCVCVCVGPRPSTLG